MAHKILIVDDEKPLVDLCRIILESAGYEVWEAYNGTEALNLLDQHLPDLVLLDVMMPGMTGIEVCRQIRSRHPSTPQIIMYTADDRNGTRDASMQAGANAVLTKETPIYDIADQVRAFITSP